MKDTTGMLSYEFVFFNTFSPLFLVMDTGLRYNRVVFILL